MLGLHPCPIWTHAEIEVAAAKSNMLCVASAMQYLPE